MTENRWQLAKLCTAELCLPRISKLMTAQEYIMASLQVLAMPVTLEPVDDESLEDAIYAKVMSKKFRKLKADDDAVAITKEAIHLAIKAHRPVVINEIFGGNKLWRFEEAPEIDWAELFTTIYLLRWLKSIARVYEPGVHLEYFSLDVVLETMNNLPPSETDRYSETFKAMLTWLQPFIPPGVSVGYKRYGEQYRDRAEYLAELEKVKAKVLAEHDGRLPSLTDAQKAATELNVKLKPGQADDPLWREKVELTHLSIERTETLERYINDHSMIPAAISYFPGCVVTGSTKQSYAKFWVGVGALKRNDDSFREVVLTPSQLASADFDWEDIELAGLQGKNFAKIRVLKG